MRTFRNTEHLYQVMGALLERVGNNPVIAKKLVASNLIVRFRYRDPDGVITINLTKEPLTWTLGDGGPEPDVEMTQSADLSHLFWLGEVNVPMAIATRKIIARGSVPKALALLPAVKPLFDLYPQALKGLGYEELIPKKLAKLPKKRWAFRLWSPLVALRSIVTGKRPVKIDYEALNRHFIPLLKGEVPAPEVALVEQKLPITEEALKVEMLRRMLLIRTFEEALAEAFATGEIPSEVLHLSVGQEACATGACFALQADDYLTTTHRGHGHMLAKGAVPKAVAAEIFGKGAGVCGGKGGTMHVTEAGIGALGANGIVGASTLIATGAALAIQQQRQISKQTRPSPIALAFCGDGATNQGMFHEALNFAAVFQLPVIFVIENNLYGEFTPLACHTRVERLSTRSIAYNIPGVTVDGNDVWAVYEATREAIARARDGNGPTLIEYLTYRWRGHTEGESAQYRTETEIAQWRQRCPITRLKNQLRAAGIVNEAQIAEMETEVKKVVAEALDYARNSAEPPLEALTADVYAPEPLYLYSRETPQPSAEREVTYSQAIREALAEEMTRDERVYLLGEDVSTGGYFGVTIGLIEKFGPERVIDTPISEYAIVGSSVGAAMVGRRPIAEIQLSDFLTCCMDPIINQAAKLRYMSAGQYRLPLVVRTPGGAGLGLAAQHSQSLEALLLSIPGLILCAPGTPYDAKGLLKAAIRSNNPVIFFENKLLYLSSGKIPAEGVDYIVPLGVADIKRVGADVTLVAIGAMVPQALDAAKLLSNDGIDVEIVDVRTIKPLDLAIIVRSVVKTRHLVIVEPGPVTGGIGSEIMARVIEVAWGYLSRPPKRVAALDIPIPYNRSLENAAVPDINRIVTAVRQVRD